MAGETKEEVLTQLAALGMTPAKVTYGQLPSCSIGNRWNYVQEDDEESRRYYEEGEKRAATFKNHVTLVTSKEGLLILSSAAEPADAPLLHEAS